MFVKIEEKTKWNIRTLNEGSNIVNLSTDRIPKKINYNMKKIILVFAIVFSGCNNWADEPIVVDNSIRLNINEITLTVGQSDVLTYVISPGSLRNEPVKWSSSSPDIVSVKDGKITAQKIGVSNVSVEITGLQIKSVCEVTVVPVKVEGISLNESEISIFRGNSFKLIRTIIPARSTNNGVKWESSNIDIAGINSEGIITAKAAGNCIIKAITDDGGFEASCKVNVMPVPVTGIAIEGVYLLNNPYNQKFYQFDYNNLLLCHGESYKIKITFNPENADNQNLAWESSDENLATVREGIFAVTSEMKKRGMVYIVATSEDGGHKTSVGINVDDVHLVAHGREWVQFGNTNIVSFSSSLTFSMYKSISIGSIYIVGDSGQLIQVVSNIVKGGFRIDATSDPIDVSYLGLSGQSLSNVLSSWKFVYVYKLSGMDDYIFKEVVIDAHTWWN